MERVRRIEAYGLCRGEAGEVLVIPPEFTLPGDTVMHGEHPEITLIRTFAQHGLRVAVTGLRDVITELDQDDAGAEVDRVVHHDHLIFDVRVRDGQPAQAVWVDPAITLAQLPPLTSKALGLASDPTVADDAAGPLARPMPPAKFEDGVLPLTPPSRQQRFAAYGLVTDPAGRVLLTRISDGYPGAGRWHLPGGGTDFGESAKAGLLRELIEETDQVARVTGLIGVSHRHQRDAVGPELVAIDWHGVRVVFRAIVDHPSQPQVIEPTGSTSAAAWFEPAEALGLDLTEVAYEAVAHGNAE